MSGELRQGAVLDDRFTLVRRLGAGSTGAVWLARDRAGGVVACKILHPKMSDEEGLVAQMMREARVLTQLSHPNITRPIEFSTEGRFVYLAMEFVDGKPLQEVMGEQARQEVYFSGHEVLRLYGPLCEGVAYAHSKYIVHRDLKPHNVMVVETEQGPQIKVLDFGLARLLEGSIFEATTFGRALGSLFYMSPEQTRGEPATTQSDVFALGALLFELTTLHRAWARDANGQPVPAFSKPVPGAANNLATVFERLAKAPRPRAKDVRPDVPAELDALICSAMALDPGDRPKSVPDLYDAAHAHLEAMGRVKPTFGATDPGHGATVVVGADPLVSTEPDSGENGALPRLRSFNETVASTEEFGLSATNAEEAAVPRFDDQTVSTPEPASGAGDPFEEPELPPGVGRRVEDDNRPTQTLGPGAGDQQLPTTAEVPKAISPETAELPPLAPEPGPIEPAPLHAPPAAVAPTEPGDLRQDREAGVIVTPASLADRPKAVVTRRPGMAEKGPSPRPRRTVSPLGPRHVEAAATTFHYATQTLVSRPWPWVAAAFVAGLGGLIAGYAPLGGPQSPTPGVVEILEEDDRPWRELEQLLQDMDSTPENPQSQARVRDAVLEGAALLPSGVKRDRIERLVRAHGNTKSVATLRSAALLLMSPAESQGSSR